MLKKILFLVIILFFSACSTIKDGMKMHPIKTNCKKLNKLMILRGDNYKCRYYLMEDK